MNPPSDIVYPPVEVYLNSLNAVHGSDYFNDCSFQFSRPIIALPGYSIYLQVLSFTMPHCFHVVSDYNRYITINGYSYTLDAGNYSIFQLVNVLKQLDPNVTCVFDSITLKCTFTSKTGGVTISGPLCSLLGITPSTGPSVSSTHTVDMSGVNSIYVLTDLSSSNTNIDTRVGSDNVLCRIPVSVPAASIILFEDYAGRSGLLLDDSVLSGIHLKLEDEDRRPLLATLHWQMVQECRFIYTGWQTLEVVRPYGLIAPP
jgi:hypothetical protein